jgi:hypothetical protein
VGKISVQLSITPCISFRVEGLFVSRLVATSTSSRSLISELATKRLTSTLYDKTLLFYFLAFRIFYNPKNKGSANFDLKCFVEKIKAPLELSVTCNCYEVEAAVSYIDQSGKEVQLVTNRINILRMGAVMC